MRSANDNSSGGDGTGPSAYRLSRVFAEGWNAAQKIMRKLKFNGLTPSEIASINPYGEEPERSRWTDGFNEAIDS
jgi:phosphatidylserine/phosphatidylglycerophosphate/cardiolipin synthase-like enzyme